MLFKPHSISNHLIREFVDFNLTLKIQTRGENYKCDRNSTLLFRDQLITLNKEISVLTTLIGQTYLRTRHKRALLLIGGKILKALFGVVTEDEVQKLKRVLQILDHTIHDDKHYRIERDMIIARLAHSHHSLIKLVKTHISEAQAILVNHEDNIEIMNKFDIALKNGLEKNLESRNCLWKILQTQMHYKALLDLIYGLEKLKSGYLSREIIPVNKLLLAMNTWNMILFRNFTLNLAQNSPQYYYNNKLVKTHTVNKDILTYIVKIPARDAMNRLDIFKVFRFGVPALTHNNSVRGYTMIDNVVEFLIINSTHYSTEYTRDSDRLPSAYQVINSTSCYLAIFLDMDHKIITAHCIFNYYAGEILEFRHILVSDSLHIVISEVSEGNLICGNNNTHIDMTPMSIVELPCTCMLTTESFVLDSGGDKCDRTANYTMNTGINIPLFLSLKMDVSTLGGGDLLNLSIPEMQNLHVNFSRQMNLLDLQDRFVRDIIGRAENLVRLDSKYSKPYPLQMGFGMLDYGPVIGSFILSSISLCVSFYLLYRLHGLFAILLGFRSALGANLTLTNWEVPDVLASLNLSDLSYDPILANSLPDPWNDTMSSGDSSLNSNLAIGFYALLCVILGLGIYKVTRCIQKARSSKYHIMGAAGTKVYLKIKYQNDVYAFDVCNILQPISAITCPTTPLITAIRPPRFSSRSIEVEWTQFALCEYFAGGKMIVIRFPRKFKIPRDCAAEVRAAIRSGSYEASIMMADAHGNTMSMRTDAMDHRRGTTEL